MVVRNTIASLITLVTLHLAPMGIAPPQHETLVSPDLRGIAVAPAE